MQTTPLKMASQIKEGFHPNGAIKRNRAKISKYEKKEKKIKISLTDPNSSPFFKRNVPNIIANSKEKFRQEKSVEANVDSTERHELHCREVIICWSPFRLQI